MDPILRTLLVGPLAYVALVIVLRTSGKRTLSKMNAFDLVVTVSLGSTLATVLISQDVSLSQGVTALALLVGLQFVVGWSSVRLTWMQRLTRSNPALLFDRDGFRSDDMVRERITEAEIRQAVRSAGFGSLDRVGAVVLESDGTLSVIAAEGDSDLAGLLRRRADT